MTASAASWDHSPFTVGVRIPFTSTFNIEQLWALREGFVPEEMDQKFFIYYEEPFLYFHSSWSGQPIWKVTLEATTDGARVIDAQWHYDLAAEDDADPIYQAKLLEYLIDTRLFGIQRQFPLRFSVVRDDD